MLSAVCLSLILSAAQPKEAKEHFEQGMNAYNVRDWPRAIAELKQAYSLDAQPGYLFALGQAQRLSGDCEAAIFSYRAYLRTAGGKAAPTTGDLVRQCEETVKKARADKERERAEQTERERLAAATAVEAKPRATVPTTSAEPTATQPAAVIVPEPVVTKAPPRWYQDALGHVLLGVGVAGVATGAVLLVLGNSQVASSATAADYGGYLTALHGGAPKQIGGLIGLGAGGAFVLGAIWRYFAVSAAMSSTTVAVAPTPGGGALVVGGRF